MKNFLGAFLILCSQTVLFAQNPTELVISGISPEVEKSFFPGEIMAYHTFDNGNPVKNIKVIVTTEKGDKNLFGSVDLTPDESGHYNFEHRIPIKESSSVSFAGDIQLLVSMPTICGNTVWTKITRRKENLSDPIILDQYSLEPEKEYPVRNKLMCSFTSIAYDNDLKDKVKSNGDDWKGRKKGNYRFMIKNVGDSEWKVNETASLGRKSGDMLNAYISKPESLDLNKTLVMRVEVTTKLGNILWNEVELEARGITRTYFGTNYSIVEPEEADEPVVEDDPEVEDTPEVEEEEGNDEASNGTEESEEENTNSGGQTAPTGAPLGSVPKDDKPDASKEDVVIGATDLTTKTVEAACPEKVEGDTLVSISGSKVCLNGLKKEGAKSLVGSLTFDCNFQVGNLIIPLKAGEIVKYSPSTGKLMEGVLRADLVYNSSVGEILLKEGSLVAFNGSKLVAGSLAKDANLMIGSEMITCTSNDALDFDIRFDNQGRIKEFTAAQEVKWNANIDLIFPVKSRLVFKGGDLSKVISVNASSFDLNGTKIEVMGHQVIAAYDFNANGELSTVNAGSGNNVDIEGQMVKVKEGTEIKFSLSNGKYMIVKFIAAETVEINVYKRDTAKKVTVKAGKKIVISEGKVVKAG